MLKANYKERDYVVETLANSFADNKSINYVISRRNKEKKLRELIKYSFEQALMFGDILISDDKKAVALIIYPDKKRTTVKSVLLDIKLAFKCFGIKNLIKAIKRESAIKKQHPHSVFSYLWFIGVKYENRGKGSGTQLLIDILNYSEMQNRPVLLETSTLSNLPWYKKKGFKIYAELDFGYRLYCLKSI